jgi:hypothetical protein
MTAKLIAREEEYCSEIYAGVAGRSSLYALKMAPLKDFIICETVFVLRQGF